MPFCGKQAFAPVFKMYRLVYRLPGFFPLFMGYFPEKKIPPLQQKGFSYIFRSFFYFPGRGISLFQRYFKHGQQGTPSLRVARGFVPGHLLLRTDKLLHQGKNLLRKSYLFLQKPAFSFSCHIFAFLCENIFKSPFPLLFLVHCQFPGVVFHVHGGKPCRCVRVFGRNKQERQIFQQEACILHFVAAGSRGFNNRLFKKVKRGKGFPLPGHGYSRAFSFLLPLKETGPEGFFSFRRFCRGV